MADRINGIVSEWNGSVEPPYGFIDVDGSDKRYVAFSSEDGRENREQILRIGAAVTFVYEPGTYEQVADDVRLRT